MNEIISNIYPGQGFVECSRLKQISRATAVAWDRWRDSHPEGRLVVGADRERAIR